MSRFKCTVMILLYAVLIGVCIALYNTDFQSSLTNYFMELFTTEFPPYVIKDFSA